MSAMAEVYDITRALVKRIMPRAPACEQHNGRKRNFMLIAFIVALMLLLPHTVGAFSEPTELPPGGNVIAPLNTSSTTQTKAGTLIISCDVNNPGCQPLYTAPTPGTKVEAEEFCLIDPINGTEPACPPDLPVGTKCSCRTELGSQPYVRVYSGIITPQNGFADIVAQRPPQVPVRQLFALQARSSNPTAGPNVGIWGKMTTDPTAGEKTGITGVTTVDSVAAYGILGCVRNPNDLPGPPPTYSCKTNLQYLSTDAWAGYFVAGNFGTTDQVIVDSQAEWNNPPDNDLPDDFPTGYPEALGLNTDQGGIAVYQDTSAKYLRLRTDANAGFLELRHSAANPQPPLWLNRSGQEIKVEGGNVVVLPGKSVCLYGSNPAGDCHTSWPSAEDIWEEGFGPSAIFPVAAHVAKDVLLGTNNPSTAPFRIEVINATTGNLAVKGAGYSQRETCLGDACGAGFAGGGGAESAP